MSIDSSDDFDIADTVHRRDAHHRPGNSITRVSHEPRNFWNQQEKPETMLALLRPPLPQRPQDASTSGPPSRRTRSRERRSPPIELGERAAERPVDLVYNPSQGDKNMTVQLMMDIEEDWAADLEAFCRLRRLGRFKDAKEHFKLRLEHLSSVPIIWLQYAEMLLACGDHKAIEASTHPPELVEPSSSTVPCSAEDQVLRTYQLFNLLWQSRHRPPSSIFAALRTVHRYRSSTEIQLLCSCLRVLHHIGNEPQHGWPSYDVLEEIRLVDFRQIYCNVVGDRLIWDFRDLFVALASLFGWETASTRFFGSLSDVQVLDTIAKDWGRPFFEEGSTMGLLDLFTSLILQNPSGDMKSRNLLLLQRAQALVESIQRNDPDLMRSRPFTRYLLAKAVCEMNVPPQRPNEGRLGDFKGFAIDQGPGIHLPICVPGRHFRKPSWGSMFFSPATVEQRRVVEVAAGAAHHAGDHRLHADALKLLAFQSDDPSTAMDALARLQLDTQGDRNGYVATCLSRFNVSKKGEDEMNLLRDLDRVDRLAGELHFEEYVNDYLRWAWIIIRILLVAASRANSAGSGDVDGIAAELFANETAARKWKFPPSVMNFSRGELGIPAGQERPHAPLPPPWSWERDGISVLKYGASHDSDTPIYSTRHVKFAGARRPPPPPPRLAPPHRAAIYTWHDDSDSDSDSDSDLLRTYSEVSDCTYKSLKRGISRDAIRMAAPISKDEVVRGSLEREVDRRTGSLEQVKRELQEKRWAGDGDIEGVKGKVGRIRLQERREAERDMERLKGLWAELEAGRLPDEKRRMELEDARLQKFQQRGPEQNRQKQERERLRSRFEGTARERRRQPPYYETEQPGHLPDRKLGTSRPVKGPANIKTQLDRDGAKKPSEQFTASQQQSRPETSTAEAQKNETSEPGHYAASPANEEERPDPKPLRRASTMPTVEDGSPEPRGRDWLDESFQIRAGLVGSAQSSRPREDAPEGSSHDSSKTMAGDQDRYANEKEDELRASSRERSRGWKQLSGGDKRAAPAVEEG